MTSTYTELGVLIGFPTHNEATFETLLTAMRARSSRFENVIEFEPPQLVAEDIPRYNNKLRRLKHRGSHVGMTGAEFPKLERLVGVRGFFTRGYTKEWRLATARLCFDKPELEVVDVVRLRPKGRGV